MSANSSFRDAVVDDGRYVLYQVTTRLYQGESLRPDIFFQKNASLRHKDYNRIFNADQRNTIKDSGMPVDYNIKLGASKFDVSIHALLAEHTCGLPANHSLYQKIKQVKNLRNKVVHPDEPIYDSQITSNSTFTNTDGNLNEKLQELLILYNDIIENLENMTNDNLHLVKVGIERRINQRKQQPKTFSQEQTMTTRQSEDKSNDMPTWGKVAIGVAIGAGVGAGAAALIGSLAGKSNDNQTKEKPRRNQTRTNQNKEECMVM